MNCVNADFEPSLFSFPCAIKSDDAAAQWVKVLLLRFFFVLIGKLSLFFSLPIDPLLLAFQFFFSFVMTGQKKELDFRNICLASQKKEDRLLSVHQSVHLKKSKRRVLNAVL